jgi:serine/threonine-protein kinase
MDEIIQFLATGSPLALVASACLGLFSVLVAMMYTIAFFQGRAISFWPPSIGERVGLASQRSQAFSENNFGPSVHNEKPSQNPIVNRGTLLEASSSKKYRVTSAFYGGANATIFKVQSEPDGDDLIAKVYWRGLQPSSPPWEIFNKEISIAEVIEHRNIVKTLDRGLHSGYPFSILEYFSGGTLRDWLRAHNTLKGSDILSIASQIAEAVDHAHTCGVVHRDVKPGNILFEDKPQGRVALSDFGIAAILGATQRDITAIGGEFVGSATYLAPEAISEDSISPSMDIYSFGVVLFEMICNGTPFDNLSSPLAVMRAKVEQDAKDIRDFRPDVPAEIAERLGLVMSREVGRRPKTASSVIAGLESKIRQL